MEEYRVKLSFNLYGGSELNHIIKAVEPDNKVEGVSIRCYSVDNRLVVELCGKRLHSIVASINDLIRVLSPLFDLESHFTT